LMFMVSIIFISFSTKKEMFYILLAFFLLLLIVQAFDVPFQWPPTPDFASLFKF